MSENASGTYIGGLNCKPGDLAIVIGGGDLAGRLVEVLYAAPQYRFRLPDGHTHVPCKPGYWVLRSLGSPMKARCEGGGHRMAMVGTGPDSKLRPLPGVPTETEVNRSVAA